MLAEGSFGIVEVILGTVKQVFDIDGGKIRKRRGRRRLLSGSRGRLSVYENFVFIGRMLYINERDLSCMSLKVVSTVLPRVQKASEYSLALPSETLPLDDTNVFPVLKRREHRAKAHYACELECGTHVKVK